MDAWDGKLLAVEKVMSNLCCYMIYLCVTEFFRFFVCLNCTGMMVLSFMCELFH